MASPSDPSHVKILGLERTPFWGLTTCFSPELNDDNKFTKVLTPRLTHLGGRGTSLRKKVHQVSILREKTNSE